jgi:hypothetical protein
MRRKKVLDVLIGGLSSYLSARHATDINSDDLMEAAIPEILDFCAVFRAHVADSFVASQLLRMALLLDYGDEMGRRELFTVCNHHHSYQLWIFKIFICGGDYSPSSASITHQSPPKP